MFTSLLLILLLCLQLLFVCVIRADKVIFSTSSRDRFIYDQYQRVRVFHGVNLVNKGFPWYPTVLLDINNIKEMKSWGFNTIRLGVMWSGVEPQENVYNQTYIDIIATILTNLEENGIYAIIDLHQDVLSTRYCLYDGFPSWFINYSNNTSIEHSFPWPLAWDNINPCPYDRSWAKNYFSEECGNAFQNLYDNYNGMRNKFEIYWRNLAKILKNKNILGYEIINEPFPGNIYKKPSLLLPGIGGKESLQPFYDIIATALHEEDSNHIVFYEPVTWGMILNGTLLGSGFNQVPGGKKYQNKSIFSFHYYCWWFNGNGTEIEKITCDKMFGPKVFKQVMNDIDLIGGSAMLTEWGQGCQPYNNLYEECDSIMNLADEYYMSWTEWYWSGALMDNWNVTDSSIQIFSRTYAQSIAGIPIKMNFNSQNKSFQLIYNIQIINNSTTIIYYNKQIHYPNGIKTILNGDLKEFITITIIDNYIELTFNNPNNINIINLNTTIYFYIFAI